VVVDRSKRKVPLIDDYHLLTYQTVDSTNEEAKRLVLGGGAHGAFLWSLRQTAGRGSRNRDWISHDGNLFVSILLQPGCNLDRLPQLSYVTAIAARESISPLFGAEHDIQFKWPNDILLNGKKLAGILLESLETTDEYDHSRQRWSIVGLGMNIESCPDAEGLSLPATYIKENGPELVSAKIVLSRFIHEFIHWYSVWQKQGFPIIRDYWMRHCAHHGQELTVKIGNDEVKGQFSQLDRRGNLILKCAETGGEKCIAAGEVIGL